MTFDDYIRTRYCHELDEGRLAHVTFLDLQGLIEHLTWSRNRVIEVEKLMDRVLHFTSL